jgi:hypothetical protein
MAEQVNYKSLINNMFRYFNFYVHKKSGTSGTSLSNKPQPFVIKPKLNKFAKEFRDK